MGFVHQLLPGDLLAWRSRRGRRTLGRMLIVDGNLTLQAGFEFFGVVLVRGALFGALAAGASLARYCSLSNETRRPLSTDRDRLFAMCRPQVAPRARAPGSNS